MNLVKYMNIEAEKIKEKIKKMCKEEDEYFEEEDFEEEIFDEENGIVGFEYVSVEDNNTDIIEEETEDENEENIEDIEE